MKNLFLTVALLAASTTASASKARIASLQGADHVVDTQTMFVNPSDINSLGQYITYEMGAPGTAAEGGFSRKFSNGDRLAIYLGHANTISNFVNGDIRTSNNFSGQNNPVEVIYGTGNMGFGGSISTIDDKKNGVKETSVLGKFGLTNGNQKFYAHLHLISTAENITAGVSDKLSAPQILIGGSMDLNSLHFFGSLNIAQAKLETGATSTSTDIKDTNLSLGVEDRGMKTSDNDIYYGAKLDYVARDVGGAKITGTQLPVFLGMEYQANSWAVFRGSVAQNLLIGSVKDETATNTDAAGISSNTTVAAGLGLKYNNLVLDGSLTAATSGAINGNAFLANAAVTYNF